MLQRDDLLRIARITDYNRYIYGTAYPYGIKSFNMFNVPGFEFEYVQSSIREKLDNGCYFIKWQDWKKATVGGPYDPHINQKDLLRKMQTNEIRTKKEMKTSELRTLLETSPLQFTFEKGRKVIVLPKLTDDQHSVYVKWSTNRNLYTNQYSLVPGSYDYQHWFNETFNPMPKADWRYLLSLDKDASVATDPTDELYKFFDGVYTGDIEDLKKGTEIYTKEFGVSTSELEDKALLEKAKTYADHTATKKETKRLTFKKSKIKHKLICNVEEQKMVCIQNPTTKDIIRVNKHYTGPFLKDGWTFVSKEEYKLQQKNKFKKRKEMSQGNLEAQLLEYKGPRSERRNTKQKGVAGSPYEAFQTIKMLPKEEEETIQVKRVVPQYEYHPVVWTVKQNGVVIETIPFLNKKGEPLKRKYFIGNKEEYVTITRDTKPAYKTIKVLQIPSKKMVELKTAMSGVKFPQKGTGTPLLSKVKSQRTKYLLSEDRNGNQRWEQIYSDPTRK